MAKQYIMVEVITKDVYADMAQEVEHVLGKARRVRQATVWLG